MEGEERRMRARNECANISWGGRLALPTDEGAAGFVALIYAKTGAVYYRYRWMCACVKLETQTSVHANLTRPSVPRHAIHRPRQRRNFTVWPAQPTGQPPPLNRPMPLPFLSFPIPPQAKPFPSGIIRSSWIPSERVQLLIVLGGSRLEGRILAGKRETRGEGFNWIIIFVQSE